MTTYKSRNDDMEWSTDVPVKPGVYWAHGFVRVSVNNIQEVVEIVSLQYLDNEDVKDRSLFVFLFGDEMIHSVSDYTDWIGPLDVPLFTRPNPDSFGLNP